MTIAFLSLFFGLITGSYPVELSVQGPVATVELLVDGRSVRTLQGPPSSAPGSTSEGSRSRSPRSSMGRRNCM